MPNVIRHAPASAKASAAAAAKALVLAAALILLASSCSMPEEEAKLKGAEETPDAVFTGFGREEVENGIVTFTARAERAEYYQDKGLLIVYNVTFEDRGADGGAPRATGQADKVVYHEDTGDAEFSGFVQVRSIEEDATFETTGLSYRAASQTIEGAPGNPVVVKVGKRLFIEGVGFFADIQSKAFAFRNGAKGVMAAGSVPAAGKGEEK